MTHQPGQLPVCFLAAILSLCPGLGWAHDAGLSTAELNFSTNGLDAELIFAGADFGVLLEHFGTFRSLTNTEAPKILGAGLENLKKLASDALTVEFDGQAVSSSGPRFLLDEKDNFHLQMVFPGGRPRKLLVRGNLFSYLPPRHLQFVSVHDPAGKQLGNKMLKAGENTLEIQIPLVDAVAGNDPTEPHISTFGGFVLLGVKHIWTGYDHLLFLSALLLVCRNFRSAIQVVTCFTVAHSLTLAFATLNLVWVSSRVVEPAIAASIAYIGVENLVHPEGPKGRWLITFVFGLIHGLGFASVLRDMGVASSSTGVTLPLIGFNLGVEAGQIVVAGLLLPVIWKLRNWEPFLRRGIPACSAVVAAAGCYWLAQRIWFV